MVLLVYNTGSITDVDLSDVKCQLHITLVVKIGVICTKI